MPPRVRGRAQARSGASTSRSTSKRRRDKTPTPPPSPLPWDFATPAQTNHYKILHKREIAPTKFFDPYTIETLGLRGAVHHFLQNVGWIQYATLNLPTYKQLTYEFLSSLSTSYDGDGGSMAIEFRCLGENRRLTLNQFNAMFGFGNEGIAFHDVNFNFEQAWIQLTGQVGYNPSSSKSRHIQNHALRYIHRCMSLGLFGRGLSTGVVSKTELLFLWAMANNIEVNSGVWIVKHLLHVSSVRKGKICIGGLITHIANAFGFQPVEGIHEVVEGSTLVDMETLINMRMGRHIGGGQFRLLDDEGHIIQPPDEDEGEDEDEAHQDEDEVPQQEAQQQHAPPPEVDMGGQPAYDAQLAQIIERLDRLDASQARSEARQARIEELQLQMLEMLQRMNRRD